MVRRTMLLSTIGLLLAAVSVSAQNSVNNSNDERPKARLIFKEPAIAEIVPPPKSLPNSTGNDPISGIVLPGRPLSEQAITKPEIPTYETVLQEKTPETGQVQPEKIPAPLRGQDVTVPARQGDVPQTIAAPANAHYAEHYPLSAPAGHYNKHARRQGMFLDRFWDWLTYRPLRSGACCGHWCVPCCRPQLIEFFHCYPGHRPRCSAPGH